MYAKYCSKRRRQRVAGGGQLVRGVSLEKVRAFLSDVLVPSQPKRRNWADWVRTQNGWLGRAAIKLAFSSSSNTASNWRGPPAASTYLRERGWTVAGLS